MGFLRLVGRVVEIEKCSIRLINQTVLQARMKSRKIATARHCRKGPTCVYPAICDGWRAGAWLSDRSVLRGQSRSSDMRGPRSRVSRAASVGPSVRRDFWRPRATALVRNPA